MRRSQPGPSASTSAGSLKRQLSPEMPVVGSLNPSKQTSRRPTKRTKPTSEASQPTPTMQGTARPMPASPAKVSKGRVTATQSDRTTESGEQIRPGIQPVIVPQPIVTQPPPTLSGNFDLYGMYLPFLAKLCLPQGATTPDYSAVYDRILASQARHDYTARCFLAPQNASSFAPPHGRFESATVLDPMAERPFDITLDTFTYKKLLSFTPTERSSFQAPEHSTPGPGLVGHTGLSPVCGIKSAKGVFKIKRAWTREQDGVVKELFEGFFSFSVCYDSMYRKAGHGNGAKYKFAFWGVRAMKDNTGKEIGLGPRKW
ncbi:hypothetical protein JVT61DRAFT_2618 [Boletus reticuloceps]|uniref:Uncharacterized protein n=1 Tax=Boletus reticuloceps TaxID=495285 RepID=A0A8I3AA04_9AGAM|nr:hypothetical protein JVT61DRAFT_2618 [Boletus reticuloceps]